MFGPTQVTCTLRTIPTPSSGFLLNGARPVNVLPLNKCFGTVHRSLASRLMIPEFASWRNWLPALPRHFQWSMGMVMPPMEALGFGGMPRLF